MKRILLGVAALAVLLGGVQSLQADPIPAVKVDGRATGQSSGDTTVGFSFSTNNTFSIDALAAYGPVTGAPRYACTTVVLTCWQRPW